MTLLHIKPENARESLNENGLVALRSTSDEFMDAYQQLLRIGAWPAYFIDKMMSYAHEDCSVKMSVKDFAELIGISEQTVRKALSSVEALGFAKKVSYKEWKMNEDWFRFEPLGKFEAENYDDESD